MRPNLSRRSLIMLYGICTVSGMFCAHIEYLTYSPLLTHAHTLYCKCCECAWWHSLCSQSSSGAHTGSHSVSDQYVAFLSILSLSHSTLLLALWGHSSTGYVHQLNTTLNPNIKFKLTHSILKFEILVHTSTDIICSFYPSSILSKHCFLVCFAFSYCGIYIL